VARAKSEVAGSPYVREIAVESSFGHKDSLEEGGGGLCHQRHVNIEAATEQFGALKNAKGQAPGAGTVEAPIAGYPNFEHLEAEGQRLLPEQLKAMLKALGRSNLLRGDTH
jgi:hypothetical protein